MGGPGRGKRARGDPRLAVLRSPGHPGRPSGSSLASLELHQTSSHATIAVCDALSVRYPVFLLIFIGIFVVLAASSKPKKTLKYHFFKRLENPVKTQCFRTREKNTFFCAEITVKNSVSYAIVKFHFFEMCENHVKHSVFEKCFFLTFFWRLHHVEYNVFEK